MLAAATEHPDASLADDVAAFYADPLGFVMYAYDWTGDPSLHVCRLVEPYRSWFSCEFGPDEWACEFLDEIGRQVRERQFDGITSVQPIRMATSSGHGIGKSALTAWLVDWIMSTRPHCRVS